MPATGAGRRVRALWEIAGLERKSAVVGWWATWPARGTEGDPSSGYVVSDRVLAKILLHGAEDRDTLPASLYVRLAAEFPANKAVWHASFDARFASFPENVRALVWESFLIDAFAWRTALLILDDPLLSTEIAYLRWLDATVFTELAARPGERLVIVADPGRSAGAGAEGFVAAVGGGATPRCVGPAVDDLDVAPIVLREASLPASGEMQGRAPDRCFEGAAAAPPKIATWGRRGRAAAQRGSDYDPEMVERLKSLGYLR